MDYETKPVSRAQLRFIAKYKEEHSDANLMTLLFLFYSL